MAYYASSEIKVYPTSLRSIDKDYEARLNTERNITSLVNRLSSINCFIVSGILNSNNGLNVNTQTQAPSLAAGTINIHGYLFEVGSITLTDEPTKGKYLAFRIHTKTFTVDQRDFNQLDGIDDRDYYTGLEVGYYSSIADSDEDFYLPIALFNGTSWDMLNCTLKYEAKDLKVDFKNNTKIVDSKLKKETDIQSWLADSFIVDDGELD